MKGENKTVIIRENPWDDVERLFVARKERGRGLTIIQDNIDALIRLEDYIKKRGGRLITATGNIQSTQASKEQQ